MYRPLLLFNIIRAIVFGFVYSIFEVDVPFNLYFSCIEYRILYFIIFTIANAFPSFLISVGNVMLSMASEDIFYWVIKREAPFSYAWYYPVFYGIPIAVVTELLIAIFSYMYARKN